MKDFTLNIAKQHLESHLKVCVCVFKNASFFYHPEHFILTQQRLQNNLSTVAVAFLLAFTSLNIFLPSAVSAILNCYSLFWWIC